MWKENAMRLLIGIGGLAVGALFVVMLQGAARADAERLHVAQERANAVAAASARSSGDADTLVARTAVPAP